MIKALRERTKSVRGIVKHLLLIAIAKVSVSGLLAETLFIAGNYKVRIQASEQEPKVRDDNEKFRIWISDGGEGKFKLELQFGDESLNTIGFDGESYYRIAYNRNNPVSTTKKLANSPNPFAGRSHPASISDGDYPFDATYKEKLLWLAFSSRSYLKDRQSVDGMPAIWMDARRELASYEYSAELLYTDNSVLNTAIFRKQDRLKIGQDGILEHLELDFPKSENERKLRESQYNFHAVSLPDGFVRASYSASSITNLSSFSVPKQFELEYFQEPGLLNKSKSWLVGQVDSVQLGADVSFKPEIDVDLYVKDRRFRFRDENRAIDFVTYSMKPGDSWKPRQDKLLEAELNFQMGQPHSRRTEGYFKYVKFGWLVMIFVLISVPIIAYRHGKKRI